MIIISNLGKLKYEEKFYENPDWKNRPFKSKKIKLFSRSPQQYSIIWNIGTMSPSFVE